MSYSRSASRALLVSAVFLLLLPASRVLAGEFTREFDFAGGELKIDNLIGALTIVPADDDVFRVIVHVRGSDAAEDLLDFSVSHGSQGKLVVIFPVDDYRDYVYPPMGPNSRATVTSNDAENDNSSWLKKIFHGGRGKRIKVRGKGDGLELWADLTIEVPRGGKLGAVQRVGRIDAADVTGNLVLDTSSGNVAARGIQGDVGVDTGSGDVKLENIEGGRVVADTGSGDVAVLNVECERLAVDTGSGDVSAKGIRTGRVVLDTGSGDVWLQPVRLDSGEFMVDTGSGDVTLVLPDGASARISADTGSGRVDNRVSGAMVRTATRDELDMTVGDGEAKVSLDVGSGSIVIK